MQVTDSARYINADEITRLAYHSHPQSWMRKCAEGVCILGTEGFIEVSGVPCSVCANLYQEADGSAMQGWRISDGSQRFHRRSQEVKFRLKRKSGVLLRKRSKFTLPRFTFMPSRVKLVQALGYARMIGPVHLGVHNY